MDGSRLLRVAAKWGWVRIVNGTYWRNLAILEDIARTWVVCRLTLDCHLAIRRDLHCAVK